MSRSAREISLCAVMCALAAVIMCLGTVIPVGTYACPMLASLVIAVIREECRKSYGLCAWAVITVLSLLLAPDKEAAMLFAVLGYYPLIQPALNRIKPKALQYPVKLLLCLAAVALMFFLLLKLFGLDELITEFTTMGTALFTLTAVMGVIAFFVYDYALPGLTAVYRYRIRPKLRKRT